jgi:hypothetical protein
MDTNFFKGTLELGESAPFDLTDTDGRDSHHAGNLGVRKSWEILSTHRAKVLRMARTVREFFRQKDTKSATVKPVQSKREPSGVRSHSPRSLQTMTTRLPAGSRQVGSIILTKVHPSHRSFTPPLRGGFNEPKLCAFIVGRIPYQTRTWEATQAVTRCSRNRLTLSSTPNRDYSHR